MVPAGSVSDPLAKGGTYKLNKRRSLWQDGDGVVHQAAMRAKGPLIQDVQSQGLVDCFKYHAVQDAQNSAMPTSYTLNSVASSGNATNSQTYSAASFR